MMPTTVEQLRLSGKTALAAVYQEYRKEFIKWARNSYQCEDDEAKDIYQSTIITVYENVITGKLTELSSSFKTYIFAIGKNKIREMRRKQGKHSMLNETQDIPDEIEDLADPELIKLAGQSLDRIGEPCKSLLQEFYYYGSTMTSIVEKLGYKNEDAAKSQKYKCLVRLRAIFKDLHLRVVGL